MAYDVVPIQDSDGDEHGVAGDTLGTQFVPGYKIILGAKDVDGGFVAAGNPLPVTNQFLVDAFQRVAVANPSSLFDSQFEYDLQSLLWEQITSNGGSIAHVPNQCAARLSTTTTNGSTAALQSRQYFRYQPGKAQQIFVTFVLGAASANVLRRVGYFDAANGIFLEQNGTTDLAIVRRTKTRGTAVDNRVIQANWNVDPLDGSGDSGITLDLSKSQILVIDLQFLGVGRVRIGFDVDGVVVWCHEFLNANSLTTVYMSTANLPLRYEQTASTGASAATMDCICASVISNGGFDEERGYLFGSANAAAINAGNGTRTAMLGIRPAATFNSIANRTTIIPLDVSVVAGSTAILVEVLYNTTLSGGSWAAADAASAVQVNKTPTGISGGIVIAAFHVGANGQRSQLTQTKSVASRLPLVIDSTGANPIALAIAATGLGGASSSYAAMSWKELR